jgi:hypothetical protein
VRNGLKKVSSAYAQPGERTVSIGFDGKVWILIDSKSHFQTGIP